MKYTFTRPLATRRTRETVKVVLLGLIAFATLVMAFASVAAVAVLQHWVDKGDSAWTAPWINVINRGPVQ